MNSPKRRFTVSDLDAEHFPSLQFLSSPTIAKTATAPPTPGKTLISMFLQSTVFQL
jgi:hypothetical protein